MHGRESTADTVWQLHKDTLVASCALRNQTAAYAGSDVQLLEDADARFSKRCRGEEEARFTAECFCQDYVRAGFSA